MPDNFEMQGLEFQIKAKSEDASKGIDAVIASFEKLKKLTKGTGLDKANNQLDKLNKTISDLKKTMEQASKLGGLSEALEKVADVKISSTIAKRISEIADASKSITPETATNINMLADALVRLNGIKIGKVVDTSGVKAAVKAATGDVGKAKESDVMEEVSQTVEKTTETIAKMGNESTVTATKMISLRDVLSTIRTNIGSVTGFMKKLVSGFASISTGAFKAAKGVISFVKNLHLGQTIGSKFAAMTKAFTSRLGSFLAGIKRIAYYRLLRTIIKSITSGFKEGMENLYRYSQIMGTDFAPNMDRIATSLLYLKNSLGAVTDPIVARLAPALDLIVDKFVDLLNIVNQLIATLNGESTYTAAKKYATTWQEAADDTKKSVDEIKRYVLGFDELNILGKVDNSKGSASDSGLDYSKMFEERAITSGVQNFVDTIKKSFKKKDFENLGRQIADWINSGIAKVPDVKIGVLFGTTVNNINDFLYGLLDDVNTKALGEKIGSNFTAAVKTINWGKLGVTAGTFVTRIIDFYNGIIRKADLGELGKGIGQFIANAVDTINWTEAADNVSTTINKIGDFIAGLFDNAKLGKLGESIAGYINRAIYGINWSVKGKQLAKAFNGIISFFEGLILNTDFAEVGKSLATFLSNAIKNVKWKNLGKTIASAFTGIADFFIGFIENTNFKDVGNAVGTAIKSFLKTLNDWFAKQDFVSLGKTLISGAIDLVEGLDIGGIIKSLGLAIWNLLKAAVQLAFGMSLGIGEAIVNAIGDIKMEDVLKVAKQIGNWFKSGFTSVATGIWEWLTGSGNKAFERGQEFANGFLGIIEASPLGQYLREQQEAKERIGKSITGASAAGIYAGSLAYSTYATAPWSVQQSAYSKLTESITVLNTTMDKLRTEISKSKALEETVKKSKILDLITSASESGISSANNALFTSAFLSALLGGAGRSMNTMFVSGEASRDAKTADILGKLQSAYEIWEFFAQPLIGVPASAKTTSRVLKENGIIDEAGAALNLSGNVTNLTVTDGALRMLKSAVSSTPTTSNVTTLTVVKAAKTALQSAVGALSLGGTMTNINPKPARSGLESTVKNYALLGVVKSLDPTSNAYSQYYRNVKNYGLTGTVTKLDIEKTVQASLSGAVSGLALAIRKAANGGIVAGGRLTGWGNIPHYAGGTTRAHGSLFVAGEAGAEIVGNVNGRTEILNKSQIAQAMYSASVAAMQTYAKIVNAQMVQCANAVIHAIDYTSYNRLPTADIESGYMSEDNMTALVDGVREGVYEATARQNDLLRQQNEILLDILAKDNTAEITTNSVVKALANKNRRDGKYSVPVGVT